MYRVLYGDKLLHDPRSDVYYLAELSLDQNQNECGYCEFTMSPRHPLYDALEERNMSNPVRVYDDEVLVFQGFVYELGKDFETVGAVKCKGDLSLLSDSRVRPYSTIEGKYNSTAPSAVDEYFKWLIDRHNEQVGQEKRFVIGINEGNLLDKNNYIYRESTDYPTTFEELDDKILDDLGGVIRVRYPNGVRTIDLMAEWYDSNTQMFDFGVNLMDYDDTTDASEIYTAMIATGAKMRDTDYNYNDGYFVTSDSRPNPNKEYYIRKRREESGEIYYESKSNLERFESGTTYYEYDENLDESDDALMLTELDDGVYAKDIMYDKLGDLVYSHAGVQKYGWIVGKYTNTDIITREGLLDAAVFALKASVSPLRTIEVKAVDLSLASKKYTPIRLGEYVRVRSKPHKFDSYMLCSSIDLDLSNPENSTYTLGTTFDTLTGQQNKRIKELNAGINHVYEQAERISEDAKNAALKADKAVRSTTDEYTISDSFTNPPETGWSETTPPWQDENLYIWRRTKTIYGDESIVYGSPAVMTGNTGKDGAPGEPGKDGADAITLTITSSEGTVFKNAAIATTLTAHVYKSGIELTSTTDPTIDSIGTIKWYKDGNLTPVSTGRTLTISAGDVSDVVTYTAKLEG